MSKPVPLSAFRVPAGMVGLTLDLHGCDPATVLVAADRLEEVLAVMERAFGLDAADRGSTRTHCRLRGQLRARFRRAQRSRDEAALAGLGPVALWLAFNHPEQGGAVRRQASEALRRGGGAQVTVASNRNGLWGFAVAGEFVDLGGLLDAVPGLDGTLAWERPLAPARRH